ncbi:receptor-like protein 6 [Vitis vinifera]|uniref:receptor-like protein 6 n=1 Tax=Vitis vinifera TaxID=29760 RepID=UPI002882E993|nr:receptor-like protein 6 [Vitis vinifera]
MLSKLKNLTDFQLSGNRLSVLSYTRTNVTLPKFKLLGLGSCNLTEFPDFLQNQDELELLFLSNNRIHGPIPKWMWNISQENLGMLDLSGNLLTGFDQHPVVLPWSRLRALKLDYNMLQGPLPIPPPSTIEYSVSRNKLTGEISPLICNMSSLMLLDLSNNNLSGRIPQCLANLSKSLSVLDLGSNSLDGPIPQTCTVTNNLRVIDLGENQFQGQIPRSFANCMMLEHLVLGNNQIDDIFPFWLGALPQLQVLILRSNRFHGAIGSWQSNFRFPKLRIIDLSDNKFIGDLPSEYFQNWDAMKLTDIANNLRYMQTHPKFQIPGYSWIDSYMYSMRMTNKGMQRFYEQIPDIFIAIDFSGNNFKGQIPTSIGNLKGLHLLNLGGNNLTGHISSSLGDLTQLESLDLSQNQLSGEIPLQLTRITFLAFFNVSNNHLSGPIPQGKQFATFSSASFDGNPGLCGSPLSRACGSSEASPPTSSSSKQGSTSEFDWKFVLMGYGSGLVIGVSIGYCLTSWKHEWFVKTFGKRQRKWTRKERRGAQRLNLSNPNFLERFLKLCILLELLDFYLHFFFLYSHGVASTCVCVGKWM